MIDPAFLSNLFAWACQVALISAVAALLLRVLRIEAPSIRYASWRIVLALCIALPILQPWKIAPLSVQDDDPIALAATGQAGAVAGSPSVSHASTALPAAPPISWPALAGVALVAGAVLRLAWLGAGILRLRRLRKAGEPAAPCDGHDEIARLIEAGAEIRYVQVIGQPVTFGVRHPVVLLPESLRSLPESVQRAVLAHELWHVRRRDWMWILTEEVVRAILWFHPAIWFLVSRIQSAREEVVDELTVFVTNSRRGYIEALLAFADEPPLFAAAPFARRRHLFQRMLLISREAVMSSRRIVVSGAALVLALLATISIGAASFPLTTVAPVAPKPALETPRQSAPEPAAPAESSGASAPQTAQAPVRDAGPGGPRPQEVELKKAIAAAPTSSVVLYYELAKIQESRGAKAEAEATLIAGRQAFPNHDGIVRQLTSFYTRNNQFDKGIAILEESAAADPSNPAGHHLIATYYEEKARKDAQLSPTEKLTYIQAGIAAEDRALTYNPDYIDAMVYKNILLRLQANLETDAGRRAQLISEADTLRNRAMELNKARATTRAAGAGIAPPPPPPPPPAMGSVPPPPGAPVRVGGNIRPPAKVRDARPVYPEDAMRARVQGVVIMEVTIDASGVVMDAKVLRSIPMLDQAAVDAVMQWEFVPTQLNGAPVPVIMTVTVNFTLQ